MQPFSGSRTYAEAFAVADKFSDLHGGIGDDNNSGSRNLGLPAAARARDPNKPLPPHPNAIDAAIHIAAGVMPDRSARHRTRPEHDAGPRHATGRIADVLAVHDRLGWRWIERHLQASTGR